MSATCATTKLFFFPCYCADIKITHFPLYSTGASSPLRFQSFSNLPNLTRFSTLLLSAGLPPPPGSLRWSATIKKCGGRSVTPSRTSTASGELHQKTTWRASHSSPLLFNLPSFLWFEWVFARPPLNRANYPNDDYTPLPDCGATDKARRINTPNLKSSCLVGPCHPRPLALSRHSRATSNLAFG